MNIKKDYIKTSYFDNYIYQLLDDRNLYRQYLELGFDNNFLYELYTCSESDEDFKSRLIEIIKEDYQLIVQRTKEN